METLNSHTGSAMSTSSISDCEVRTPSDEKVGSIKDVMLNTHTGEVSYLVLKVDQGFLNLGSKLLALPWESFQFDTQQDDVIIVKETKEKLEDAPGFDESNWPTGPQHEFVNSLHTYYGTKRRGSLDSNLDRGLGDHEQMSDRGLGDRRLKNETIADHQSGNDFLERDRDSRDLDSRRGGNPII